MPQSDTMTEVVVEFGTSQFLKNAQVYAANKRLVDAACRYDSVDDAIAALQATWAALTNQSENGGGFTPSAGLGFGSDNAGQIASALIGQRSLVSSTRKAFAAIGKGSTGK
jgi:hypothetical protein